MKRKYIILCFLFFLISRLPLIVVRAASAPPQWNLPQFQVNINRNSSKASYPSDCLLLIDVNEWTVMNAPMYRCPYLHVRNLFTRSHPSKEENHTRNPRSKRAFILIDLKKVNSMITYFRATHFPFGYYY